MENLHEEGRRVLGFSQHHQKLIMVVGGLAGIILLYEWYKNKGSGSASSGSGLDSMGLATGGAGAGTGATAAEVVGPSSMTFSSELGSSFTSTAAGSKTSGWSLLGKLKAFGVGISSSGQKTSQYAMESNAPDSFSGSLDVSGSSGGTSAADLLILAGGTYAQRAEHQSQILEEQAKYAAFQSTLTKIKSGGSALATAKRYGYIAA
jgi:hypothetical protein